MFSRQATPFAVCFTVLAMTSILGREALAQVLSPTLTLFRSESDFFSAVAVESTETFDSFPSDTELDSIFSQDPVLAPTVFPFLQTTVDDVVYSVDGKCAGNPVGPCVPWTAATGLLNADPVSSPNLLVADGFDLERVQTLSFGPLQSASLELEIYNSRGVVIHRDETGYLTIKPGHRRKLQRTSDYYSGDRSRPIHRYEVVPKFR